MKKNRKVGDKLRPIVTILKIKKNEPTVIEMSGNRYILKNEKTEQEGGQLDE